jgi:hypothetical protein
MSPKRLWHFLAITVAQASIAGCYGVGPASKQGPPPNPLPTVSSLSPTSVTVGGAAFTLTVNGTNFIASSTVQWNGSARSTTFVSSTQLQAQIAASDIASATAVAVTVSTPPPGGGISGSATFTADNPAPAISSLSPNSSPAGGAAFSLTVTGTNFVSSSLIQWNGSARATTFLSSTKLQAAISTADISAAGSASVTVSNSSPGGGTSSALSFMITQTPPAIAVLSPSSAVAAGASFTMTVTGTNFVSSSVVQWNGSARTTTFVSSTSLQAAISAADIAPAGLSKVTVSNPPANGGLSAPSTFFVGTSGAANFAVIILNQPTQDIVYDPLNSVFYLSVTGTASTNANTIAVLDPATGKIKSTQAAGSNPNVLAISDDSQFLYAGIDGANKVQRFTLPGLATDISYLLGSAPSGGGLYSALDLQVAPGLPHTTAVTLAVSGSSPSAQGGITIFDDATARPTIAKGFGAGGGGGVLYDSLQWGADASTLFAANNEDTGFDLYTLSVDSSGVALSQDFQRVFNSFTNRIHFDAATNAVYADEGHVLDPSSGLPNGNYDLAGLMVPDAALNTSFFIPSSSFGTGSITIESFDQTHFTPITTITIPGITGTPTRLIRWGQNGLAFITGGASGQVILVGGNFISPAPPVTLTSPPSPASPPIPAVHAPTIASLTPSSAAAGGAAFTMTVTGTGFVGFSTVQWNGSARTTTFISSTTLQAAVTAADLSVIETVGITVLNPASSGGASAASTFFVGSSAGTSAAGAGFALRSLSQASRDIVFDPTHQEFFLSVPAVNATGNTISVLDLATMQFVGAEFAGSDPDVLAISDDNQFLYAGIDGSASVERFLLPSLSPDITYSLGSTSAFGPQFALDLAVAPGSPHTTAVSKGSFGVAPSAQEGITIFDDAAARTTIAAGGADLYDSIQWGPAATALYAANNESTGFDFYSLLVSPTGVALSKDNAGAFASFSNKIHYDIGTNLIYSDDGHVIAPSTGSAVGTFNTAGLMVPDSMLNKAFFLTGSGSPTITITSYDLKLFTLIDSITINNVTGKPLRLIRWGQNGLAFNTDGAEIVLIAGNFVR